MKRRDLFKTALGAAMPVAKEKPLPERKRLSGKPVDPQKYLGKRVRLKYSTWCDSWKRLEAELAVESDPQRRQSIINHAKHCEERGDCDPGWYICDTEVDAGTLGTVETELMGPASTGPTRYHCYTVRWDDDADYRNGYTHFDDDEPEIFLDLV